MIAYNVCCINIVPVQSGRYQKKIPNSIINDVKKNEKTKRDIRKSISNGNYEDYGHIERSLVKEIIGDEYDMEDSI